MSNIDINKHHSILVQLIQRNADPMDSMHNMLSPEDERAVQAGVDAMHYRSLVDACERIGGKG